MTEAEVTEVIRGVAKRLSFRFTFACYTRDDIEQEAFIEGMAGLEKYNPKMGPLENFMYRHIKWRLKNLKRNKYERYEKPCLLCPLYRANYGDEDCIAYHNKINCKLYGAWAKRNEKRKSLMFAVEETDGAEASYEDNNLNNMVRAEILELIESKIPMNIRDEYLRWRAGLKLTGQSKKTIESFVLEILKEEGVYEQE
jgi:hypothetical protein